MASNRRNKMRLLQIVESVRNRRRADSGSDESRLIDLIGDLHRRNLELGLKRFDDGDVLSHPIIFRLAKVVPAPIRKLLRVPEFLAPILWRRALGIEKRLVPTALYHLGNAWLYLEKVGLAGDIASPTRSEAIAEQVIGLRLNADLSCWGHPYRHHGDAWKSEAHDMSGVPRESCAHHNARLGLFLARSGEENGCSRHQDVAADVALALNAYHNWKSYPDGTRTVSYYPTTADEVVNTGAEVALFFAALPESRRTEETQERCEGLARMIVSEQMEDGSWYYCTERHYEKYGGRKFVDNHHTAMILAAVAELQGESSFPRDLRKRLGTALRAGTDYYTRRLVEPDGRALAFPDSRREAPLAGYGEGILALGQLAERAADATGEERLDRVRERLDDMLACMVDNFIDEGTGDVASTRIFGWPVHLRSIRLGSGLVMECLSRRLWWGRHKVLPVRIIAS